MLHRLIHVWSLVGGLGLWVGAFGCSADAPRPMATDALQPTDARTAEDDGLAPVLEADVAAPPRDLGAPDAAPDAAPPVPPVEDATTPVDGAAEPLRLTAFPDRLALVEGGAPVRLRLRLDGPLTAPVTLRLDFERLVVVPPVVTLGPEQRTFEVEVSAPFDADEETDRGTLRVLPEAALVGVETEVPWVARDVHLTLNLGVDDEELLFIQTATDRDRRLEAEVTIGDTQLPTVSLNLRGQGTLYCPRKSFTLRFASPVQLADGPRIEQFVLIALCEDPTLLRSRTALEILRAYGLFPPWFTFVELRLNGTTSGLYLLIERPRAAIERLYPDNAVVLRRGNPEAVVEIDRPDEALIADREQFLEPYHSLRTLAEAHTGADLLAALRTRMDYDQYLLSLAFNSALRNGDSIDEVYFYDGPERPAGTDPTRPWWGVMAWDQDEIFHDCHPGTPVPEPLLFCAESALDALIARNLPIRIAYVAHLRTVLEGPLRPAAFRAALERSAAEVAGYLQRPGLVAAQFGVDAPAPDMEAAVAVLAAELEARRAVLARYLPLP